MNEPLTYLLRAPGCFTGPCESLFEVAIAKVMDMPAGTEIVPLYEATTEWLETLKEVASALDQALGDSDLTHIENDNELREIAPVQWACSQINRVLMTNQVLAGPHPSDDERIRLRTVRN